MPELPDITVYVEHLVDKTRGKVLAKVRLASPFVLRTADPPLSAVQGQPVQTITRLGKRIVFGLPEELFVVVHLMIAGRFKWKPFGTGIPGRIGLAAFDFEDAGTLILTEASSKKRASIHVVRGKKDLMEIHGRGGLEVLDAKFGPFAARLRDENPHAEALAHRPSPLQRHRQRLLRRDLASCTDVAGAAHVEARRRRDPEAPRLDPDGG